MFTMASAVDTVPLYRRLMDELAAQIRDKRWAAGEQLPTEVDLCALYGVSIITVRRALSELAAQGLLYRVQGKGTFVSAPPKVTVATEQMYRVFGEPSGQHRPISTSIVDAGDDIGEVLGLDPEHAVLRVTRGKISDGRPIKFESAYVDVSALPASWRRSDFERDVPFLDIFTGQSMRPRHSQLIITSALPGEEEQQYLEIRPEQPILRLRRIALDEDRRPLWLADNSTNLGSYTIETAVPDEA
jgi:DNA-binding GntR family transcriptional regulator